MGENLLCVGRQETLAEMFHIIETKNTCTKLADCFATAVQHRDRHRDRRRLLHLFYLLIVYAS